MKEGCRELGVVDARWREWLTWNDVGYILEFHAVRYKTT
jgi:hypothetical protein